MTLVEFETAKLAKEKGFDMILTKYYHIESKEVHHGFTDNNVFAEYRLTAPYQYQLQKWLRERGYHIEILLSEEHPYNEYYSRTVEVGQYFVLSHDDNYFNTYELALEDAIIKTLNII